MNEARLRSRIWRSEATAAALLADAMQQQGNPNVSTEHWAAGSCVSLGPQRYVNRLLCSESSLDADTIGRTIEFFAARGLDPSIQITSAAHPASTDLLVRRGFEIDWQRVVLAAPAVESPRSASELSLTVEPVRDDHVDDWLSVLAKANNADSSHDRQTSDEFALAAHAVQGAIDLLARVDGLPAACGSLQPVDGVGWLGGAAALPEYRHRGLQRAMLDTRIDIAARDGHDLVAATAISDSISMRNLQRAGLEVVDIQNVWVRRPALGA